MQKTEKQCKNQCFCYRKTTKISPKTGPKTQKSASGPGHLRNRKKRCCKTKNWGQKVEKHRFFHFSLADFGRAHSRTGVFRTVFYSVFWRRASRPIKNRRFWPENAPPPGKPVTFYECHPEDHAPAPSVRADFYTISLWYIYMICLYVWYIHIYDMFIWYLYMISLYDIFIWYLYMISLFDTLLCIYKWKNCMFHISESNVYNYPSRVSPNHIPVICVSNHVVHCCQSYVKASDEQPKGFSWKGRASTVATHPPSFFYRLSDIIDFRL